MTRLDFFTQMVGRRVYRTENGCECRVCASVYADGIVVKDLRHAGYLHEIEGVYQSGGKDVRYFATVKKRDEHDTHSNQKN